MSHVLWLVSAAWGTVHPTAVRRDRGQGGASLLARLPGWNLGSPAGPHTQTPPLLRTDPPFFKHQVLPLLGKGPSVSGAASQYW